jgi:hypothetical protein
MIIKLGARCLPLFVLTLIDCFFTLIYSSSLPLHVRPMISSQVLEPFFHLAVSSKVAVKVAREKSGKKKKESIGRSIQTVPS